MMNINKSLERVIKAKENHYLRLIDEIYKRIDSNVKKSTSVVLFDLFVIPSLEKILIGLPNEINELSKKINLIGNKQFSDDIKVVFKYKDWFDKKKENVYNAYDLAKNLDIPVCVYCNRMYTKTVFDEEGDKITRPTFDHWFAKEEHPLLALSFYNLIPSCNVCNTSVKGTKDLNLTDHYHPYVDSTKEVDKQITFSYYNKKLKSYSFNIKCIKKSKADNTVSFFKLKEIYETHEDEIFDLVRLRDVYSDKYLQILRNNILKGTSTSDKEIYRLAFGTHIDEAQFDRRPLSKMKKDILNELGILKYFKNEF